MLIGHYAPALVLQRARPSVKLWQLFVATQLVDVFWGLFILTGVEHARIVPGFTQSNDLDLYDMPYTHSLVATGVWALVAFVAWKLFRRGEGSTLDALVIAVAVASHFAGDYLVHAQDLPVMAAQGQKLGLGIWRDRTAALILETALFAGAAPSGGGRIARRRARRVSAWACWSSRPWRRSRSSCPPRPRPRPWRSRACSPTRSAPGGRRRRIGLSHRAREVGTTRAVEDGIAQIGALKIGALEIRAGQVRPTQIRLPQIRIAQLGVAEHGVLQVRA